MSERGWLGRGNREVEESRWRGENADSREEEVVRKQGGESEVEGLCDRERELGTEGGE